MLRHGIKVKMQCLRMLKLLSVVNAWRRWQTTSVRSTTPVPEWSASADGQNLGHGRTEATIVHAGILNGTTSGQLEITGGHLAPHRRGDGCVDDGHHGTLTVSLVGTFNAATGVFERDGSSRARDWACSLLTGVLTFVGVEDPQAAASPKPSPERCASPTAEPGATPIRAEGVGSHLSHRSVA